MHRTPRFWVLYHSESVHACFDYQAHLARMFCFIASSLLYKCCSVKASLSVRIRRCKRLLLNLIPGLTFIFPSYHTPKTSGISSRIDSVCKIYIFDQYYLFSGATCQGFSNDCLRQLGVEKYVSGYTIRMNK